MYVLRVAWYVAHDDGPQHTSPSPAPVPPESPLVQNGIGRIPAWEACHDDEQRALWKREGLSVVPFFSSMRLG